MRRLFISVAALQFALSAATAQPASTSAATQTASLDQPDNVSDILTNGAAKPLVHLVVLSPSETVASLPFVALHLLPAYLIEGATSESGIASVYAGGLTANGEQALISGMTAAHRSIPFGAKVRVTNQANGKSIVVRINDRGPFFGGRIIDLMPATARALGFSDLTPVTLVVVGLAER
jgi:rare lipoprotein A